MLRCIGYIGNVMENHTFAVNGLPINYNGFLNRVFEREIHFHQIAGHKLNSSDSEERMLDI
jgi:hypothetical protein